MDWRVVQYDWIRFACTQPIHIAMSMVSCFDADTTVVCCYWHSGVVVFGWIMLLCMFIFMWCTFDSAGRSWVKLKRYQASLKEQEPRPGHRRRSGSRRRNWRHRYCACVIHALLKQCRMPPHWNFSCKTSDHLSCHCYLPGLGQMSRVNGRQSGHSPLFPLWSFWVAIAWICVSVYGTCICYQNQPVCFVQS